MHPFLLREKEKFPNVNSWCLSFRMTNMLQKAELLLQGKAAACRPCCRCDGMLEVYRLGQ